MEKLTINHIASVLVEKYGIAPKDAEQFVAAMFDVIQDGVENDKQVKVRGLGTFKLVDVEPRESVNVNTGERVLIKGHSKISFIPDTSMKEMVNKPFSQFETVILNEGVDFAEPVAEATEPVDMISFLPSYVSPFASTLKPSAPLPTILASAITTVTLFFLSFPLIPDTRVLTILFFLSITYF